MAWQAVILHQFVQKCNMSILSIISNCSERLFSYHWNFTICLLVNFFIIVISMDCGTLMSTKKDWYREGEKSCIIDPKAFFPDDLSSSFVVLVCDGRFAPFLNREFSSLVCHNSAMKSTCWVEYETWKRKKSEVKRILLY